MMEFNDICLICLRTDRKLKTAPAALSKYHNEISKHYIDINKCNYCCICEHLLRKAFKFHQKCLTAAKILKSWENSTTLYKPPIDQLHRKLFPEPLGPWIPNNNNKVYIFDEDSLNVRETNARNSFSAPVKVPQLEISPIKIPVVDIKEEVECALEEIIIEDDPQDAIDNIVIKEIKSTLDDTHSIEVVNADIGNNQNAKNTDTNSNFNTSRIINLKRNIEESELEDDTIYLSDDDSNDDTVDEIKQLDNTSVNNDHDYIAINHTSDDDSEDNDDTTTEVDKTKPQALKFLSTLRTINEKLDDICQNWDIPALTHMAEDITTEEVRKITREHLANKISRIKFRKRSMQFKMDAIDTDLSTIIDEGKVQVRDFNADMTRREWLIWTVRKKMRAWGELKTDDGRTFDTEGIISCLDKMPQKNIQYLHQYFSDVKSSRILQVEITRILINIEAKLKDDEYSSIFDIQYLTTEKAKIEEFEQRKTYQCYLQAKNRCDKCFLTFINSGLLEYHVKTNHDESNTKYICTICPVRRTSKARIMMHIGLHDEVFRCRFCPLVTYYRKSMMLHYLRHKGESQYHCEKCNKTYGSLSVFRTHNSKYHPRGAHICTICGGSYISHTGLIFHVKRKHPGATKDAMSNELKCKTCNITFASLEEYSKHSRDRHRAIPSERYLKCDYCSLMFGTMKQRNKHAISAHGIKEKDITRKIHIMRCRVCSEEGTSAGWLMMHYSKQHPTVDVSALYVGDKAHLCEICGKGFAHKVYLNDHMNIHNGITYPCPRCNKRFVSMTKLRRHELTHKPPGFACQYCGKKFKSRPNLWSHSKLHIGDRRYKCEICGKGFLLNNALKAHIRGVHKHERRIRKPRLGTRRTKDKKDVAETDEVREAIDEVTEATYEVGETIDEGIDATEEFLESTDDEIAETMEEMEVIHEEMEIIDDEEIQYEVLETETEMIDEIPDTSYGTNTTDTVLFHDIGEIGDEIEL